MVTDHDLAVFDSSTLQRLAEMACLLNMWLWPVELSDPEVPVYTVWVKGAPPDNPRRRALREEIERRVGLGAILREWNRKVNGKTRGKPVYRRPLDRSLRYIEQELLSK